MKPAVLMSMLALLIAAPGPRAGAQAVVSTGQSFVEPSFLIGALEGGVRQAGLALDVEPGWKTYWRSPGEAGVPPSFDWSRSANLERVEIGWPLPEVFDSFGLRTVGYSGEVVLPLSLVPHDPAQPIELRLDVTLGVCRDICVFEETGIEATVPPSGRGPDAARIAAAKARITPAGSEAGVTQAVCRVAGTGEDRDFSASVEFDQPLDDPHVALEGPAESWFHNTTTRHQGNRMEIASTLSLPSDSAWVDRSALRITVLDEALAADIQGCAGG